MLRLKDLPAYNPRPPKKPKEEEQGFFGFIGDNIAAGTGKMLEDTIAIRQRYSRPENMTQEEWDNAPENASWKEWATTGREMRERNTHEYEPQTAEWYASQALQSVPESATTMLASMLLGSAMAPVVGTGAGALAGGARALPILGRGVNFAGKALQAYMKGDTMGAKAARAFVPNARTFSTAIPAAAMEAEYEAQGVIDEALALGFSREEAERMGRDAWQKNFGIISTMNMPQYGYFLGRAPSLYGVTKPMKQGLLGKAGRLAALTGSEAVEEGLQEVANQSAIGQGYDFGRIRDSAIVGSLMAPGFAGTGALINRVANGKQPSYEEQLAAWNIANQIRSQNEADKYARKKYETLHGDETRRQAQYEAQKETNSQMRDWARDKSSNLMTDEAYNLIVQAANKYNVPVEHALAQAFAESDGYANIEDSPAGAIGIMQLMPDTAAELNVDPRNLAQNIDGGVRYLKERYDEFGDWDLAHAAYNAGSGAVHRFGGVPYGGGYEETRKYVDKINGFLSQSPQYDTSKLSDSIYRGENGKGEGKYWERNPNMSVSFEGAQPQLLNAVDMLSQKYFKDTGKRLVINAGTNGNHAEGEHSHKNGWKVDIVDAGGSDVSMTQDGPLFTANYGKGHYLDEFIAYGRSLGLGMNLEGLGTSNVHLDVALDGTQWDGNGDNAGGFNPKISTQDREEKIYNQRITEGFQREQTAPQQSQQEETKPLFDINAEDPLTQKLIEQFALDRTQTAIKNNDTGTLKFFMPMLDGNSFVNTEENRKALYDRYGDELSNFVADNTSQTTQEQASLATKDKTVSAPQGDYKQQVKVTGRKYLEELHQQADKTKAETAFKLQGALSKNNTAEIENILKANGIAITTPKIQDQSQPAQPNQQEQPVSKNKTPKNILPQPKLTQEYKDSVVAATLPFLEAIETNARNDTLTREQENAFKKFSSFADNHDTISNLSDNEINELAKILKQGGMKLAKPQLDTEGYNKAIADAAQQRLPLQTRVNRILQQAEQNRREEAIASGKKVSSRLEGFKALQEETEKEAGTRILQQLDENSDADKWVQKATEEADRARIAQERKKEAERQNQEKEKQQRIENFQKELPYFRQAQYWLLDNGQEQAARDLEDAIKEESLYKAHVVLERNPVPQKALTSETTQPQQRVSAKEPADYENAQTIYDGFVAKVVQERNRQMDAGNVKTAQAIQTALENQDFGKFKKLFSIKEIMQWEDAARKLKRSPKTSQPDKVLSQQANEQTQILFQQTQQKRKKNSQSLGEQVQLARMDNIATAQQANRANQKSQPVQQEKPKIADLLDENGKPVRVRDKQQPQEQPDQKENKTKLVEPTGETSQLPKWTQLPKWNQPINHVRVFADRNVSAETLSGIWNTIQNRKDEEGFQQAFESAMKKQYPDFRVSFGTGEAILYLDKLGTLEYYLREKSFTPEAVRFELGRYKKNHFTKEHAQKILDSDNLPESVFAVRDLMRDVEKVEREEREKKNTKSKPPQQPKEQSVKPKEEKEQATEIPPEQAEQKTKSSKPASKKTQKTKKIINTEDGLHPSGKPFFDIRVKFSEFILNEFGNETEFEEFFNKLAIQYYSYDKIYEPKHKYFIARFSSAEDRSKFINAIKDENALHMTVARLKEAKKEIESLKEAAKQELYKILQVDRFPLAKDTIDTAIDERHFETPDKAKAELTKMVTNLRKQKSDDEKKFIDAELGTILGFFKKKYWDTNRPTAKKIDKISDALDKVIIQYRNGEIDADKAYKEYAKRINRFNEQHSPKLFIQGSDVDTSTDNIVADKDLTSQQRLLKSFSEKLGVPIKFVDNPEGRFGGVFKDGSIFVNVKANKPLGKIFWHESLHWLKANNPELFKQLAKAAGITTAQRQAYLKETGRDDISTPDEINEEILADQMEDVAKRTGLLQTIAGKDRGLIQRAIQWLKDTLNKFIDNFRNPQGKLTTEQATRLADEFGRIAKNLVDSNGNKIFQYNNRTRNIEIIGGRPLQSVQTSTKPKTKSNNAVKYSISNNNSSESLKQKIKDKLHAWTKSTSPRTRARITDNLHKLSRHRILYGYIDGADDIVVDHMQKLIKSRNAYDWEKLLPVIGEEIAKNLNLNATQAQSNYIADWLLTGALNKTTSPEAQAFKTAMRNNPAMAEILQETRDIFDEIANMTPQEELASTIAERPTESWYKKIFKGSFTEEVLDDLHPIQKLVDDAIKNATQAVAEAIRQGVNVKQLAQLSRGRGATADAMVNGTNLAKVRDELREQYSGYIPDDFKTIRTILESVNGDWKGLETYAVAKLIKEVYEYNRAHPEDQKTIYSGMTEAKVDAIIRDGETKFGEAQKDLVRFSKTLLGMQYDSGLLSDKTYFSILNSWKNYVPMAQVFDENEAYDKFDPLKRRHGHTGDTWSPIQTLIAHTHTAIQACERNKVKIELATLVRFGEFDSNLSEIPHSNPNVDNVITFRENGKMKYLETPDPAIKRAIDAMYSKAESTWLMKMLKATAGFMRAAYTMANPDFAAGNLMRDLPDAFIHNKQLGNTAPIIGMIRAFLSAVKSVWTKDTDFIEWQMNGGAQASFVSEDVDYIQRSITDATIGDGWKVRLNRVASRNFLSATLDEFQRLSEFTENITRVASYKMAKETLTKAGKTGITGKQLAALAAREASIDFSKAGRSTRALNKAVLFANAAVQGINQWVEAFRELAKGNSKPLFGKVIRAALMGIIPALIQAAINGSDDDRKKSYEQAPNWEKDTYWIFGNFKIPKGMDIGIRLVSNITEELSSSKPFDWRRAFGSPVWNALPSLTATLITPAVEVVQNHSYFRGAPIDPKSEQHLPAYLRYDTSTSDVAKVVGEVTGWSPRKIDYLINGYLGFMGRFVSHLPNYANRGIGFDEMPMVRRFIFTPYKNPKIVKEYYEAYEKQEQIYNGYQLERQIDKSIKTPEDYDSDYDRRLHDRIKGAYEQMHEISKKEKLIMQNPKLTHSERKERLQELEKRRVAICERVFQRAR